MNDDRPTALEGADSQEIADQLEVEIALLLGTEQSLRLVLQWMTRDRGNSRKLSTLRSAARSFERQLSRTRMLADYGGYLRLVNDSAPQLAAEVRRLSETREALQTAFEQLILRLEYVSPDDAAGFSELCAALEEYLANLRTHGQRETELLQRAFRPAAR